jgi:putative transcriptional regulator
MKRPAGTPPSHSYEGQVLIAMPSLRDGPFARSVVYVCAHREDGAMGLVINQRAEEIDFPNLLAQLDIVTKTEAIRLPPAIGSLPVLRGGPVDTGRGFVLHTSDYHAGAATVRIDKHVSLTATLDILRAIAAGEGPKRAVLALGCAGWASGQLESEILENAWLVGAITPDLIFNRDFPQKYDRALAGLGVNAAMLSAEAGHA